MSGTKASVASENLAKIYGILPQKRMSSKSPDGGPTTVNPKKKWKISNDDLVTAYEQTLYEGCEEK